MMMTATIWDVSNTRQNLHAVLSSRADIALRWWCGHHGGRRHATTIRYWCDLRPRCIVIAFAIYQGTNHALATMVGKEKKDCHEDLIVTPREKRERTAQLIKGGTLNKGSHAEVPLWDFL